MRTATILGLILIAALLPLVALPVAIFCAEPAPIVIASVAVTTDCDAQPVALLALPSFRAPPSL